MANSSASIYLRLKKRISISKKQIVKLKDAAHVLADDKSIEQQLKDMILYRHKEQDGNRVVIDLLQIIALLKQKWPDLQIDVYGDPQILVMVSERTEATLCCARCFMAAAVLRLRACTYELSFGCQYEGDAYSNRRAHYRPAGGASTMVSNSLFNRRRSRDGSVF